MEENKNLENPSGGKKPAKKEKKSSGAGTVIMVILILLLLGGVGFLLFRDQEKTKVILAKQERIDTDSVKIAQQIQELNSLQTQVEEWKAKADSLGMDIDSLQAMIVDIEALKKDLRSANRRAYSFQSQLNKIKADVATKQAEFDMLQQEKEAALAKIDTLQQEKRMMTDTISRIAQERSQLKEKVDIASIMRGEEPSIVGVSAKGKEVPGPVIKNKFLDKLKINFFLAENKVAPQNSKNVVMRLIEPDGTVLFSGTGGGSFTGADGEEKMYTMAQDVQFSGTRQKVSFIYQKGNEYKKGKHKVEFFADGHKIGETTFTVK